MLTKIRDWLGKPPSCSYNKTNENLDSIIMGLEPKKGDNVFSICGAGDQPLAFLEHTNNVIAVDNDAAQLKSLEYKIKLIKNHKFYEFLKISTNYFDVEKLERIAENISHINFVQADLFESYLGNDKYDIMYLSNVITFRAQEHIQRKEERGLIKATTACKKGALIYCADLSIESYSVNIHNLTKDIERTKKARQFGAREEEGQVNWRPTIFKMTG